MVKEKVNQNNLNEEQGIALLQNSIQNFVDHCCGRHDSCSHEIPWNKKGI